MELDLLSLSRPMRYKILAGLVVPRPIALVSTVGTSGMRNIAPYSFFNILSEEPPTVAFGAAVRADGRPKDTIRNVIETDEFVVNLMDEAHLQSLVECSVDHPSDTDEAQLSGLSYSASFTVKAPRIAEAAVSLECRHFASISRSPSSRIVLGDVLYLHVRDGLLDEESYRVSLEDYRPVGRLFGDRYVRCVDVLSVSPESSARSPRARTDDTPASSTRQ